MAMYSCVMKRYSRIDWCICVAMKNAFNCERKPPGSLECVYLCSFVCVMIYMYIRYFFTVYKVDKRSLSFQMEVVKKSFLKTLPTYSLPKNWNSLPLELKRITSLTVFKNRNKEKILSSYNFSCTVNNCYSCQS